MFKVGDMVAINVDHPSKWGIVVEVHGDSVELPHKVRVQWGWKSQWHISYNLKVVSEAS